MRWKDKGRSRNLEDRRGTRVRGGTKAKLGGATLVIVIIATLMGRTDMLEMFGIGNTGTSSGSQTSSASSSESQTPIATSPAEEEKLRFLSFLIDDMEQIWTKRLRDVGASYQVPVLVVFRDGVQSACGFSSSATGPFYCPGDQKLYLDMSFFEELARGLGASGDFAQAYVVAHEIGHHLQTLLGTSKRMRRAQSRNPSRKNELSVLLELQADCYAGIWAHDAQARNLLEVGDLQEALTAAMAIGDDTLQKKATGTVRPESWTHGSSAQRRTWFQRGFEGGSLQGCDTFAGESM